MNQIGKDRHSYPRPPSQACKMAEQQKALVNHIFQWESGGKEVYLVGDFNNWEKVLVSTPNGYDLLAS